MSKKYFLYLLSLIYLSIETKIELLDKYSERTVYEPTYIFLTLNGVYKGDELTFDLILLANYEEYLTYTEIYYKQANDYSYNEFEYSYDFEKLGIYYDYNTTWGHYYFHFSIKLEKNTDYLLIKTPIDFYNQVKIRHNNIIDNSSSDSDSYFDPYFDSDDYDFLTNIGIAVIIVTLIIFAIIITIICCMYARRKYRFLPTKTFPQQNYPSPILPLQNLGKQSSIN